MIKAGEWLDRHSPSSNVIVSEDTELNAYVISGTVSVSVYVPLKKLLLLSHVGVMLLLLSQKFHSLC